VIAVIFEKKGISPIEFLTNRNEDVPCFLDTEFQDQLAPDPFVSTGTEFFVSEKT